MNEINRQTAAKPGSTPANADAELVRLVAIVTEHVASVNRGERPDAAFDAPPTEGEAAFLAMLQIPAQGLPGIGAKAAACRLWDWENHAMARSLTADCERLAP